MLRHRETALISIWFRVELQRQTMDGLHSGPATTVHAKDGLMDPEYWQQYWPLEAVNTHVAVNARQTLTPPEQR
jgi:hypothetical protein